MEDIEGNQLQIGDEIYFTFYNSATIYEGKVHRITNRRMYIKPRYSAFLYYINKSHVNSRIIKIKATWQ